MIPQIYIEVFELFNNYGWDPIAIRIDLVSSLTDE